ncbi:MAG: hypothetical protein LWY06_15950 [Firmicutes bacterium]|nr:hypothetical protein [Bacillota bacterium]
MTNHQEDIKLKAAGILDKASQIIPSEKPDGSASLPTAGKKKAAKKKTSSRTKKTGSSKKEKTNRKSDLENELRSGIGNLYDLSDKAHKEAEMIKKEYPADHISDRIFSVMYSEAKNNIAELYSELAKYLETRKTDGLEIRWARIGAANERIKSLDIMNRFSNESDENLRILKKSVTEVMNGSGNNAELSALTEALNKTDEYINDMNIQNKSEFRKIKNPTSEVKAMNKSFSSSIRKYMEGLKIIRKYSNPANGLRLSEGLLMVKKAEMEITEALGNF